MFTALVTFLVTITMILGGAGSPVDVILENLSLEIATTFEVDPVEEPEEAETPKGNTHQVGTGQVEGFEPPPNPDPGPDPAPAPAPDDCELDGSCPAPDPDPDPYCLYSLPPAPGP